MRIPKEKKWIAGCSPDQPVTQVARQILKKRLAHAWKLFPLTAAPDQTDPEYVHQLRVATRRATAASKIFSDLLPSGKAKKVNKHLKQIRQTAGRQRDLDVLSELLEDSIRQSGQPLEEIRKKLDQQREQARQPLIALQKKYSKRDKCRHSRRLPRQVKWKGDDEEPTFGEWAVLILEHQFQDFLAASREDLDNPEHLHQLRIEGKRVRYTLEVLEGAFGKPVRKGLYPRLKTLQDQLGEINDLVTARKHLLAWAEETSDPETNTALVQLAESHHEQFQEKQRNFLTWWREEESGKLEKRFRRMIEQKS